MKSRVKIVSYNIDTKYPTAISNYINTGKGVTADKKWFEALVEDTMYDDDGYYTGELDGKKIRDELNSSKDTLGRFFFSEESDNNVKLLNIDSCGNKDIISISKTIQEEIEYTSLLEEAYGDNIEEMNKIFYDLDKYLETECDVWINDIWPDSEAESITVLIERGDWKHDHARLDHYINKWAEDRGYRISIEEQVTEDDGSDVYSSQHIIHFFNNKPIDLKLMNGPEDLTESYDEKDEAKIENILSRNDIQFSWFDDNTIDFNDSYEAKKAANLLKRFRGSIDFNENQLVFESLNETIDKELTEGYSYKKVEKAIKEAIDKIGGELFERVDNDSCSYRFKRTSRKAIIQALSDELKNTGYTVLSDNSGIDVQDNDNWWQGHEIKIYKDDDNSEKGFSFFIISIYRVR